MFTGIIEGTGLIKSVHSKGELIQIEIKSDFNLGSTNIGDSISVNGCCLTITSRLGDTFWVDVSLETAKSSTLGKTKEGDPVNLERAMAMGGRFGGHIVSGHIDAVGRVKNIQNHGNSIDIEIEMPPEISKYIVVKGSIAIDGVSLTVNSCSERTFSVTVIPHTKLRTTFARLYLGKELNLEVDILGKYVEKLVFLDSEDIKKGSEITEEFLRRHGFGDDK